MQQTSLSATDNFSRTAQYLLVAALISVPFYPAASMADSYLDEIQAEARNTTMLEKAQEEHKKLMASRSASVTDNSPAPEIPATDWSVEQMKEFEEGLYQEFPGNFIVYNRLTDVQKMEVFTAYQQADRVKGIYRYGNSISVILKLATQ